jgi:universal stress protein E
MHRFRKILYVVEPAVAQATALRRAAALAESSQAELTLLAVVPPVGEQVIEWPGGVSTEDVQATVLAARRAEIEAMVAAHPTGVQPRIEVRCGRDFIEIIRRVLAEGHDLVIKAAEDPGWASRLFGSEDMHLMRKCPCPVWLLRADGAVPYRTVLAAIDVARGNQEATTAALNREILELAANLAIAESATLHLVHVWDAPAESLLRTFGSHPDDSLRYAEGERERHRQGLDEAVAWLAARYGNEGTRWLKPQAHLLRGNPRRAIPMLAAEVAADVVVMGTVGRTGVSGLLIGNTAESILDQLGCAVLALKPAGFRTPVTLED